MRILIDTDILIYPFDGRDPARQARAREVLRALTGRPVAALSSQALSEFASVMLRKLGVPADRVYGLVERYEQVFPVYPVTPGVVLEAVRGVRDHGFSYYDAQVWAVAKLHQVAVVLSEDFAVGSSVEGVEFEDPLAAGFDAATLG